jgi:WD40 repeat protein
MHHHRLPRRFRVCKLLRCIPPALLLTTIVYGKTREIGKPLGIRPIMIRNIGYSPDGRLFAVPNFISAGSVALFQVTEQGTIARIPRRLSEKNFVHSSGLFYLRKEKDTDPWMAFISLPELLSGYTVDFSETGRLLAVAGGNAATVYDENNKWEKIKSLTIGSSVTRAMFSHDETILGVISDGKLFLFSTADYSHITTIEPINDNRFSDIAFSRDDLRIAVFEFRSTMLNYGARVRIYFCRDGSLDRDLPYFPVRPSSEPVGHLPLVSWAPGDTALAVSIPTSFSGKVYLIKSNDGTLIKEFKGFCHAYSPDGTLFAAQGRIYSTRDWSVLGTIPRSTVACAFSPTERVIVTITMENIRRFRIEE